MKRYAPNDVLKGRVVSARVWRSHDDVAHTAQVRNDELPHRQQHDEQARLVRNSDRRQGGDDALVEHLSHDLTSVPASGTEEKSLNIISFILSIVSVDREDTRLHKRTK
jgi:hypothetical protein